MRYISSVENKTSGHLSCMTERHEGIIFPAEYDVE